MSVRITWIAIAIASPALAQPQDSLVSELEATQRRAADRSVTLREREQAADKAMELRDRAINAAKADDARLPGWLMDSAAGQLAKLGRDGSDAAVLFGIPLPAQTENVREGSARALALLDRAIILLDDKRQSLEGAPAEDPLKLQVAQDRTVRAPFFASRARVLFAATSAARERTQAASRAFEEVGKLALSSPGPEAIRRVSVGAALLMRAQPTDATDAQTALDEFGWVLTSGQQAAPGTRAEAWLGLIAASGTLGKLDAMMEQVQPALTREPFIGADGRADSLLAVLATDAISRSWAEQAIATKDRSFLDRAVNQQQTLLRRTDLSVRADSLRPIVYQKLNLLGERARGMDLPPAMDLAGAIDAARDAARRDEAIKRLEAVAQAPDAGDFAADALWELAVLHTQGTPSRDDRLKAVDALTRLAKNHPASPLAPEAISAALAHAQTLAREPGDAAAVAAYREALKVVTSGFGQLASIDVWRYEYARVLVDREPQAPVEDYKAALTELRGVPQSAAMGAEAVKLLERVQAHVLDEAWQRVRATRPAGEEAVMKLCRAEVLPEARRAVDWAQRVRSPMLERFRADQADALTEVGDSSGRMIYQDLLKQKAEVPGGTARLQLGLARCLMISGDTADAFGLLRELGSALDAPVEGGPSRPEAFWHAWTLMLEELTARNTDGSRTGTIRANIKRLETIDASLGGEPWKRRITRIRDKVK